MNIAVSFASGVSFIVLTAIEPTFVEKGIGAQARVGISPLA
jgi:C4-dicarboxylate transporter